MAAAGKINCKMAFGEQMQLTRHMPPEKINCKLYFFNQLQLIRNGRSQKFNCKRPCEERMQLMCRRLRKFFNFKMGEMDGMQLNRPRRRKKDRTHRMRPTLSYLLKLIIYFRHAPALVAEPEHDIAVLRPEPESTTTQNRVEQIRCRDSAAELFA